MIDPPSIKLAGVPSSTSASSNSRRRSSRSGGRFLGSGGVRKNSISSGGGGGSIIGGNNQLVRIGGMATILGSSSPDVSPTTPGPSSGLPLGRDNGIQLSISTNSLNGSGNGGAGMNNGMGSSNNNNNNSTSSSNSMHRSGPGSDHGSSVAGGGNRERAPSQSSDRDMPMSNVSQSGSQMNGSGSQNRKRQSVDGVEYPRRRATIAVRISCNSLASVLGFFYFMEPLRSNSVSSAKYVDRASHAVMVHAQNAGFVSNSMQIVSIGSQESSSTLETN